MQEGYKVATKVPLGTVECCRDALELCREMALIADPEMVSDVGTGALLAQAGAQAAAYNVRINLRHISDEGFAAAMRAEIERALAESSELAGQVAAEVERVLAS
jgi:formiminotetrahydrofolate cyclodeaminase